MVIQEGIGGVLGGSSCCYVVEQPPPPETSAWVSQQTRAAGASHAAATAQVYTSAKGVPDDRAVAPWVERRYPLRPESGFLPTRADLEAGCGPRARAIVLNSPSNPLGTIMPAERLRELLAFAAERDLWVISDECYDAITFDDTFASTASVGYAERVLSCYSFSKTYAMTGWRVGCLVAPPESPSLVAKLQQALLSCVNAPAQMAALAALRGPQDVVAAMRAVYRERRDAVLSVLERANLAHVRPAGAFYVWVHVSGRASSAREFALELLRQQRVAVAPGTAFGPEGEGWVRLSLATSTDDLLEGVHRLAGFAVA